MKRIKT